MLRSSFLSRCATTFAAQVNPVPIESCCARPVSAEPELARKLAELEAVKLSTATVAKLSREFDESVKELINEMESRKEGLRRRIYVACHRRALERTVDLLAARHPSARVLNKDGVLDATATAAKLRPLLAKGADPALLNGVENVFFQINEHINHFCDKSDFPASPSEWLGLEAADGEFMHAVNVRLQKLGTFVPM